jgi:sugar lactone lactonase YvrE/enterochelin esterase-like enzyme
LNHPESREPPDVGCYEVKEANLRFDTVAVNHRIAAMLCHRQHLGLLALTSALLSFAPRTPAADDYVPGPDSTVQEGVPKGEVIKDTFAESRIFPGTWREYWVYIPKQLDSAQPAPVMIFQDGIQYKAPVVFDNLIHKKEIPPLVGVFVMHGRVRSANSNALDRFNRSYEYDGLGDNYARFLLDELLPQIARKHHLNLSTNGNDRAIAGASSGGICAFTAAWERPDAFRRVFSSIGTFVGLRGGNNYPILIRKTEPKPIRIFLQDGSADQNIYGGDWWMANQEMERALVFAGYDVQHAWGDGGHNGKQATAIFPEVVRWLWRDYPGLIVPDPDHKSRQQPLLDLLVPSEGWQLVSEGHGFTEGPAVNRRGEVFFTDIPKSRIHKVGADGRVTVFAEDTGNANGLMFGPDGRLYACANGRKQIVAYDEQGHASVVADGLESNDVCVNERGDLYVTDPGHQEVWFIPKTGERRVVDKGVEFPNGVRLSPDQSLLYVADMRGQFVYSYSVLADGSLTNKQPYFHIHLPDGSKGSGADGMTVDTNGTLYVATAMGVQFCDQAGRVNGILPKPQNKWLANLVFGGPDFSDLYITCGDKVYKRRTRQRGVVAFEPPRKPKAPRL